MTSATQDAELRERLRKFIETCEGVETTEPVQELTVNEILSFVKSELSRAGFDSFDALVGLGMPRLQAEAKRISEMERELHVLRAKVAIIESDDSLSRAGGERTQAGPGAVTTENLRRLQFYENASGDMVAVLKRGEVLEAGKADIRENVARETASLHAENATLRSQLAAVEAARAKAREGAAPGYVQAETEAIAFVVSHNLSTAKQEQRISPLLDELARRALVMGAQAHELSTLRAALAKAEEEAGRLHARIEASERVQRVNVREALIELANRLRREGGRHVTEREMEEVEANVLGVQPGVPR